ncbi:MAG: hypothetical protein ACRC3H_08080 [Lachnospiraceae bacterium]
MILYFFMVLFVSLSLISMIFNCFAYPIEIAFYVLAACNLFSGCYYLISDVQYGIKEIIKPQIVENPYTNRIVTDYRLRTVIFAVPGVASNVIFAVFNGVIGILSHSAWFGTLAAYYILLSIMRIGAVNQERKISRIGQRRKRMKREIAVYLKDSILFIVMAGVLGGMVILMELSIGGKTYPGFTIYAAAAYAFYKIIISTIHIIKAGKRQSPLIMIIRKIGYMDACVSILTLQTAMLATFGNHQKELEKMLNGITGAAVCLIVLGMGIQGICSVKK